VCVLSNTQHSITTYRQMYNYTYALIIYMHLCRFVGVGYLTAALLLGLGLNDKVVSSDAAVHIEHVLNSGLEM